MSNQDTHTLCDLDIVKFSRKFPSNKIDPKKPNTPAHPDGQAPYQATQIVDPEGPKCEVCGQPATHVLTPLKSPGGKPSG